VKNAGKKYPLSGHLHFKGKNGRPNEIILQQGKLKGDNFFLSTNFKRHPREGGDPERLTER
jgi:hypothetical protein